VGRLTSKRRAPARGTPERSRRALWPWAALFAALVAFVWFFALPLLVERRAISELRSRGVESTISATRLGFGTIRFGHVSAQPGRPIRAELSGVVLRFQGLRLTAIEAEAADVTIETPMVLQDSGAALKDLLRSAPLPEGVRFECLEMTIRMTAPFPGISHAGIEHLHVILHDDVADAQSGVLRVVTAAGAAGPWTVSAAHEAKVTRFAVAADGDKARVLVVHDEKRNRISVQSKDSRLGDWHIPSLPEHLADIRPNLSLTLESEDQSAAHATFLNGYRGAIELRISALSVPPLPAAVDVAVLGNVAIGEAGLRIERGTLAIGRLVGGIGGTLSLPPRAFQFRFNGNFRNVPCAAAMADLAPNAAARILGGLAEGFGVDAGTLDGSFLAQFDGQHPPQFELSITRPCLFAPK
jgi:hypothetical protein